MISISKMDKTASYPERKTSTSMPKRTISILVRIISTGLLMKRPLKLRARAPK